MDDAIANEALMELLASIKDLTFWMAGQGSPDRNYTKDRKPGDDLVYTVANGYERDGNWAAFNAIREEGTALAAKVRDQRRNFEVVGRSRGL